MSSRITALWCWYHGGPFRGYQSQTVGPTVEGELHNGKVSSLKIAPKSRAADVINLLVR